MTRTCKQCGEKFEKGDVPKEYLYSCGYCSRGCRRKYRREDKRCYDCKKELPDDYEKSMCPRCLEKSRNRQKKKQERYKREGRCPACRDKLPADGRNWDGVYCPECQEKYRNDNFYGEFATDAEIRNGLHTDMVENKLDLED